MWFLFGLVGANELLFSALTNADPEILAAMARNFQERNQTISDVYSEEVREAIVGNGANERRVTMEVFTNQTLDYSGRLAKLETLEDWADQVDNGYELFHYGGLTALVDILTGNSTYFQQSEILRVAGRVFAAAVQNNEKTQAALLEARPGTLAELARALSPESPWVLTAASALLRRTPEVPVSEEAVAADEVFRLRLAELVTPAAPEWLQTRGQRLLAYLE